MFAHCKVIWSQDDFDQCFQRDFIATLLPLGICAASMLVLLCQFIYRHLKRKWPAGYQRIDADADADADASQEHEESHHDGVSIAELPTHCALDSTSMLSNNVETHKASVAWDLAEVLALLGQISICTCRLLFSRVSGSPYETYTFVAVWSYLLVLAATRLFMPTWSRHHRSFSDLRLHALLLYSILWLINVVRFRTVLLHPDPVSNHSLPFVLTEILLSSVLLSIVLLSRDRNKIISLIHKDGLKPSREPAASLLSLAMFGWVDAIVWHGYKKTLELSDVWDLAMGDKAAQVLAEFRQIKKTHSLAARLLLFSKRKLLLQGLWAVFSNFFAFLPTLLVRSILQHIENPGDTPASLAWTCVMLLFVSGVIKTVGDNQALWIGRRVCIRFRAIIIGEIYAKALRRPAAAAVENEAAAEKDLGDSSVSKTVNKTTRKGQFFGHGKKPAGASSSPAPETGLSAQQASNGTIINLMSIDSFKVSEVTAYLHFLWASVPVELTLATVLVYSILGKSSFAGIFIMIFVMPLNFFVARSFQRVQQKIMASTDSRIHSTNEVLQNIRIIKYFAWEGRFSREVSDKRRVELRALRRKYVLWASAATLWSAVPILTTFASFFFYTVVEQKRLLPSVAFPALSMFALLRIPLDQLADMVAHVQEAKVSIDRVEEFLKEEETEKYAQIRKTQSRSTNDTEIAIENATLAWTGIEQKEGTKSSRPSFRLIDIDIRFEVGQLHVITGPTGSGKTSLLMAILGEMKLLRGHIQVPGGHVRQNLWPDHATGLTESVAFCAQQAWLVNDTIRENVLFASPLDHARYKQVIFACALDRDLEILDAGDQTLVGEKGIALSGGQKQRISLARALYSRARHVLLDDCLSAVDSHTARHIFDNAIQGDLMQNRTCVLVTHNISLAVPSATYVVVLDNGKVRAQGSPTSVIISGALGEDIVKSRPGSRRTSATPSRVNSNLQELKTKHAEAEIVPDSEQSEPVAQASTVNNDKFIPSSRLESKAEGRIKTATLKTYLKAMGPWYFWTITLITFTASQAGSVATNVWIRHWATAYRISEDHLTSQSIRKMQGPIFLADIAGVAHSSMPSNQWPVPKQTIARSNDDVYVGYYLGVYALIGVGYVCVTFCREMVVFAGSLHASWRLHERLLSAVSHAKFNFFDSTPLGQLMNRFSKDIEAVDQEVSPVATGLVNCVASVTTIVILISVITPGFLVAGFLISCIYFTVAMFYIRSSRDLKRIESVQRSPLYQAFGETLSGIVTIRAYGDELRFIAENQNRVNTHNRPFIYLWATNRWLAVRADLAGALVAFSAGLFVMYSSSSIEAGAAGLSLAYAITFTDTVLWLVRLYGANEQNMNSVERIKEYLEIEQEARAHIPETKPAANWPSRGAVEFIRYSTRYRTDLAPVLRNITFHVREGEKVGIVGRTGAGKSSLALALLRGLEAEAGKILIDDVDIGLIGLQALREAITVVPQDPTLFAGSLRSNLDPFELFSDDQIFTALQRVHIISRTGHDPASSTTTSSTVSSAAPTLNADPTAHDGTVGSNSSDSTMVRLASNARGNKNSFNDLSTPVTESGSNLSQGQRQLLCLARALLKSPRVLVMDEATASIDYATDSRIQDTLRELKDTTIITIAHRLHTIIDYDKVLVLDKGRVIEFDDPWNLIQKENGSFRGICESSGDFDVLSQLARKSWEEKRLVDDA